MKKRAKITVEERASRRIRAGYPWIFRSELDKRAAVAALEDGDIADFINPAGEWIARGFFNARPQLVGRVLTRDTAEEFDAAAIRRRLAAAVAARDALFGAPFYRLIHAEGDGFPGLVIDRYGDVLVVQVNTLGMEKLYAEIETVLTELLSPTAIVLRNDSTSRELEGLTPETRVARGAVSTEGVTIQENGVSFAVDVVEGQKTGWFFDQRDNRAWVAQLAAGKTMIDIFSHTGGFGITAAAKGAVSATLLDSSARALVGAKRNAELNNVAHKCIYVEGVAFDEIEKLAGAGRKYGVVCVDPPAFIKSRKDMAAGLRGYEKLARLAVRLVDKGGVLFFASCSHHAATEDLIAHVSAGLGRGGRPFQIMRVSGASADHPQHPYLPETGYLKAITFRFLD